MGDVAFLRSHHKTGRCGCGAVSLSWTQLTVYPLVHALFKPVPAPPFTPSLLQGGPDSIHLLQAQEGLNSELEKRQSWRERSHVVRHSCPGGPGTELVKPQEAVGWGQSHYLGLLQEAAGHFRGYLTHFPLLVGKSNSS